MRRLLRRLWPRGMAGQLLLLLFLSLVLSQATAFWIFADERRSALEGLRFQQVVDRLATTLRLLRAATPELQADLVAAASGPELSLRLRSRPSLRAEGSSPLSPRLVERLARRLEVRPSQIRVELRRRPRRGTELLAPDEWLERDADPTDDVRGWRRRWRPVAVEVELAPDRWLEAALRPSPPPFAFARHSLVALLVTGASFALAVILSTRRITRAVTALAAAADRLGRGEAVPPLAEEGPDEVRRATRAFNEMQARLRRFIDDRTRLLAALGHDLRTPITALRLRAEFVEEDEVRERLLATLDEMQRMVEATLAFARDEAHSEEVRELDLAALVDGVCEDMAELGRPVTFASTSRLVAPVRGLALRRALRNLIENALTYGERARVALRNTPTEAVITVDDDGPGIPAGDLERVFEPFTRLETSRSRETGGVGLGLAIARSVARAHGGELELSNRPEGGLRATLSLPLASARR